MILKKKPLGVYVHVPFCLRKCPYCSFYSTASLSLIPAYVSSLCRQVVSHAQSFDLSNFVVDSIYFGGGTPSLLSSSQFAQIFDTINRVFKMGNNLEISIECNPSSLNLLFLKELKQVGFNRLSVGVQSASDKELRMLGRAHFFEQARCVLSLAGDVGFENLSADLMIGLPGQTLKDLFFSFEQFSLLPLTHLSVYMLKIEKGTPFNLQFSKAELPNDDELANFYERAVYFFNEKGFRQYEISNFAFPGFECYHNLKYWTMQPYFGFGPSAHSYFEGRRWSTESNIELYLTNSFQIQIEPAIVSKKEEWLMLRMRLSLQIKFTELAQRGFKLASFKNKLKQLASSKLVNLTNSGFTLTTKGFLVQNSIVLFLVES